MANTRFTIRFGFILGLTVVFVATILVLILVTMVIVPSLESKPDQVVLHVLILVGLALLLGFGVIFVLHLSVTRPLQALVNHVRAVTALDSYWDRLRFRSHDELGFLAVAFNRLLHHIQLNTDELTRVNAELETIAKTDRLTGLANRRMFEDQFSKELRRMLRDRRGSAHKGKISLLMCDVDFFKQFNDHYGHMAGDACLAAIGNTLQTCIRRAGDLACRFGGEEFIFLLPDCDLLGAMKVAEFVRLSVVELGIPHAVSSVSPTVTISIGVAAAYVEENFDTGALLEAADRALYKAKAAGRNRVICSD